MEIEKIEVDGKIYDYIISSDDEKESNNIGIEETEDLTDVVRYIQDNA